MFCDGGKHSYKSGNGFSEMLSFEGLKSLRLRLQNPPQRLYFTDGFSKLTQLNTVEILEDYYGPYDSQRPIFSAFS